MIRKSRRSCKLFSYLSVVIFLLLRLCECSLPQTYLESLLSQYYFKGYDLILSSDQISDGSLLSWLKDGNNSLFSITVADRNLSKSLEEVMTTSESLEQIAVIFVYKNISQIEHEMRMAKQYSLIPSVPQPVYFLIAPTPELYKEIKKNKNDLKRLSLQFSVNSDFYIFGETSRNSSSSAKSPTRNPIPTDSKNSTEGIPRMNTNFIRPFREFDGFPLPDGFDLQELYSLKNITFLQEVDLSKTSLLQKVIRRDDFKQASIAAVSELTSLNETRSYETDQIDFLARSYNFSINHKPGKGFINITPDKKLTGMGEQLLKRDADITITSSEVLEYRAEQLTFLHSTYVSTIYGFFKQPTSNSLRDIFINAFKLDLWLVMFATWFLIIMAMLALAIVKWRLGTLHENDKVVVQEVFIWAAGAICQQGWHVCPESGSMKIVFIFALITGLVSYVGYSAALVSILSIKVIPIKSLSDLVTYRYTLYQDSNTISTNEIMQQLESQMKLLPYNQRSISSVEGLQKILNSQSAFLGVADMFYPEARAFLCSDRNVCKNIHGVPIWRERPVQEGMFVRKRSSLANFFNHRILLMYEWGIRHRLIRGFLRETSVQCLDLGASEKEPLGFNDVVTAYVILFIGYFLSLAIFAMEKLCATAIISQSNHPNNKNNDIGRVFPFDRNQHYY